MICTHERVCTTCRMSSDERTDYRQALVEVAVERCKGGGRDPFTTRERRPNWYYSLPKRVRRYFRFTTLR